MVWFLEGGLGVEPNPPFVMIRIQTGKGTMPLLTLLSIWSISLVVNLPGLAISPLLGQLTDIFPGASELEIQLLTLVPNLIIIPFVLLSGRLAESRSKATIVVVALGIYLASGVLYMVASTMVELIAVGALLGLGCGLVIPLAASLLADSFTGKYRMQQLGIKSGIANLSLVLATLAVGGLAAHDWRLPFLVYLIPVVPLALALFLPRPSQSALRNIGSSVAPQSSNLRSGIDWRRLGEVMLLYFFVCYATVSIAYNLPFLVAHHAISSELLGMITALFFLAIFLPGLALPWVVRGLKQSTSVVSLTAIGVGSLVVGLGATVAEFATGAVLMGLGLGVIQPLMYDKGVECATSERKVTLALSFVLATNYVAVAAAPLLVDGVSAGLGYTGNNVFPFVLNGVLALVVGALAVVWRKGFVFQMNAAYTKS